MVHLFKRGVAVALFALCIQPQAAFSGSPTEQIQETIGQVLKVIDASIQNSEETRKESLRDAIMPRFDWPEMARQTLGKHWDSVSARQNEFVSAFAEFLGNAYVGKITSYKDEKIIYVHETVEKDQAQVNTKIVPSKGDPTSVNYRSQFNRILAKGSFEDLLRQMKDKDSKRLN